MRNIDLESLRIFKAVVECGGVTRAALQLHRVQSNVTTRIRNMEERLGVKLFLRQGGKLVLSAEGKLLLGYAERLLHLSSEAESAVRSGTPGGVLRIGTMESTAAARLPPLLAAYHSRFPQVRIELVTGTSGSLVGKVQRFEVEAAFVARPFAEAGLETRLAFVEELVLIAPRTKRSAQPFSLPQALRERTLIAFSTGCSYRRILEDWLGSESVVPERVLELASYHAIVACVAAGSGIAIVPRAVLATLRALPEIAVHALPAHIAQAETHLVWRAGHDSVALDALRRALPAAA
jgi:DNA-binding transcriptional LysR family regulator